MNKYGNKIRPVPGVSYWNSEKYERWRTIFFENIIFTADNISIRNKLAVGTDLEGITYVKVVMVCLNVVINLNLLLTEYYYAYKMKDNEMGGVCSMHQGAEKCVQWFG